MKDFYKYRVIIQGGFEKKCTSPREIYESLASFAMSYNIPDISCDKIFNTTANFAINDYAVSETPWYHIEKINKGIETNMDKSNTQVIELCPHCDFEVTLEWNIDKHGHSIYCPNCGERIMLCSECPERDGAFHCDWSESNPKNKVCLWDNYVEKVQKKGG